MDRDEAVVTKLEEPVLRFRALRALKKLSSLLECLESLNSPRSEDERYKFSGMESRLLLFLRFEFEVVEFFEEMEGGAEAMER